MLECAAKMFIALILNGVPASGPGVLAVGNQSGLCTFECAAAWKDTPTLARCTEAGMQAKADQLGRDGRILQ